MGADGQSARGRRFIVLLLDNLFTSPLRTPRIKEIAHNLVDRLDRGDVIGVLRLNGDVATMATNREKAIAAIDAFTSSRQVFQPLEGEMTALIDHSMDEILSVGEQLGTVKHARKSLVCVCSSVAFRPTGVAPHGSKYSPEWTNALEGLARANVTMYVIDPEGPPDYEHDITSSTPTPGDSARAFAEESGGLAFVETNMFDRAIEQIWRDSGSYYLLGYESPGADGKGHTINVSVQRPGVKVRARRSRR